LQLLFHAGNVFAITANPNPIKYRQPDGSTVKIYLKGDEFVHWAITSDGYTVLSNTNGFYEYATIDINGNLGFSGIHAHDSIERVSSERDFLNSIKKGLFFGDSQIAAMKRWQRRDFLGSPLIPLLNGFPTTGTRKLLQILANFSNTDTTYSQTDFDNYMNFVNYNGTGSFRDYYLEVSYGQLTVNTTVTIWVNLPQTHDYYGPQTKWGEFAYDAIVAANLQDDVNFSEFDNNGDDIVDGIAIIHQGQGQEESGNINDIWSHSWDLASAGYTVAQRTFDDVLVLDYTTMPEKNGPINMTTIGVMCHEFGHNLGSPDFYDTDLDTNGQYAGTGNWDLMAGGSWNGVNGTKPAHPNAWIKNLFTWTNPTVLNTQQICLLRNAQLYADVIRYNTATTNEYFLCENRQQTGFDEGIPGHGLIIYHVDGNYILAHTVDNKINAGNHQGLYPVCATAIGNPPVTYGTINSEDCPFPGSEGRNFFTDTSIPNSHSWLGVNTNHPISNITENVVSKEISFNFNYITMPDLVQIEYFLDSDPGFGNGTLISTPVDSNIMTQTFNIPLANVSNGIHLLYMRGKDENGIWGITQTMPFYRLNTEILTVAAMEYFFDTDPGFGNGAPISIPAGSNNVITSLNIPLANITSGIHTLYIRARDNDNRWSIVQASAFYRVAAPTVQLSRFEYFLDTDPGQGNGIPIALEGISNDSESFFIDLSNVNDGIHTLYIRAKDLNDKWSITAHIPFYRITGISEKDITNVEFFIDQDPGLGSGTPVPVYQPSPYFQQTFTVDLSCYSAGAHKLYLRTRDDQQRWSLTSIKPVTISILPPTITVIGSTALCEGESVLLKVPKGIGRTYQWLRNNLIIPDATDSTFETILAGTYRTVINHNNVCQDTTAPVSVIVHPTSDGGTITGGSRICIGSQSGTLSLISQTGSVQKWQKRRNYENWMDINDTNLTYSEIPSFSGVWEYRAEVRSGTCPADFSDPASVIVDTISVVGAITGISSVCQGETGISYSISPVWNATGYIWTLPSGATIASGNNTNSILVDYDPTATSGIIQVQGTNSCGPGQASPDFEVNVITSRIWTGAISTAWENAGNWCGNIVPNSASDVIIDNAINNPVISSSVTINSLTIVSGVIVSIDSGALVTILSGTQEAP
jgi:M6 family metalloprotease-like protein